MVSPTASTCGHYATGYTKPAPKFCRSKEDKNSETHPEKPEKGAEITALPANSETLHVFHAGTKAVDGKTTVSGGRVLCVVGLGETIQEAAQTAYKGVETVQFEGMQYRHDIGYRAMK